MDATQHEGSACVCVRRPSFKLKSTQREKQSKHADHNNLYILISDSHYSCSESNYEKDVYQTAGCAPTAGGAPGRLTARTGPINLSEQLDSEYLNAAVGHTVLFVCAGLRMSRDLHTGMQLLETLVIYVTTATQDTANMTKTRTLCINALARSVAVEAAGGKVMWHNARDSS